MSLLNALHTGVTGMRVATTGTAVVGHNVANSTTPGYTKRGVRVQTADPVDRYGVAFGQGARTSEVKRIANDLVNQRLALSTGSTSNDDDLPIKTTHDIPLVPVLIGSERLGECTKL